MDLARYSPAMTTTAERAKLLASHCKNNQSETFLGKFSDDDLMQWIAQELGNAEILDSYVPQEDKTSKHCKAVPHGPILHILSGNTEHAGHQSLLRGLLIGAKNIVKLPSTGLPALEKWIASLPQALHELISLTDNLTNTLFYSAKTVVAIGSDNTMEAIQQRISPQQRFLPHGHKLSIGLVKSPSKEAAKLVVKDACAFNQQGCLSLHSVYVQEDARAFLPMIADAMAEYEACYPRGEISISESGAISNLRETVRYASANGPENTALLHSTGNTCWTAIFKNSPTLTPSVLNRVITVQPWPRDISELGPELHHLSTLAMEPELISPTCDYNVPRICPLGNSQHPTLNWHHDGFQPLGSLIRWQDMEF